MIAVRRLLYFALGTKIFQRNKVDTLQGINISHLGKRKIIFKMPFLGDMLVSWRVRWIKTHHFSGDSWMYPDPNVGPLWDISMQALYSEYVWEL